MAGAEQWPTRPACALRPSLDARTVVVVIDGSASAIEVPRLGLLLEGSGAEVMICDVAALVDPDAGTVDALARLQLTARRLGRSIRLLHASPELQELLALLGLSDVVPLRLEPRGQTEQREQSRGVQERIDPDHPAG